MAEIFYDAFISYSTKDSEFVTQLRLAIEQTGRRVWQDVKELELTQAWWEQIRQGIFNADNFVFVASPRALSSPVCQLELDYARQLQKRIITIHHEASDRTAVTRAMVERILAQESLKIVIAGRDMLSVAEANWQALEMEQNITIRQVAELGEKLPKLLDVFDKDLFYIRQASLLLGRAKEWTDSGKNASFLLLGDALTAAEMWQKAGKQPSPTTQHQDYIQASRNAENERDRLAQDQERRTKQLRLASRVAAIIGMIAFIVAIGAILASIKAFGDVQKADTAVKISLEFSSIVVSTTDSDLVKLQKTDDLVERYPDHPRAHFVHGLMTFSQRDYVAAINDFTRAIELDEGYTNAFGNRALSYGQLENYDAAIADFNHTIELEPENKIHYINRGNTYFKAREYDRALGDYNRAIELAPNDAAAYFARGEYHRNLQHYQEARDDYKRVTELDVDYTVAYGYLGDMYHTLGQRLECANAYLRYEEFAGFIEPYRRENFNSCTR